MRLSIRKPKKLTLNLTSLIDVLFILIIFFAVSSTFLEQPGIQLNLPEAESAQSHTTQKVIIYLDKEKNVFLNDQLITLNTMVEEIKSLKDVNDQQQIVLKADSDVNHGTVIRIMDLLRKNGYYKVVVSTVLADK